MLTGIIMASGESKRMGENKLVMEYEGLPLFTYVIQAAMKSQLDDLIVVTAYDPIIQYCMEKNIRYIYNAAPHKGLSATIGLGVLHGDPESDYMFLVADQPLLCHSTIDQIILSYRAHPGKIIVPICRDMPQNPRIFPNSLRASLLSLPHGARGDDIVKRSAALVLYTEISDAQQFYDIDTKKEYEALVKNQIGSTEKDI